MPKPAQHQPSPTNPLPDPPEVPGFDLGDVLGVGGAATVFEARHRETGHPCALKLARPTHRDSMKRFEREARILSRLDHRNIVALYDWGQTPLLGWIAMERADGTAMALLRRGRRGVGAALAVKIVRQTVMALQAAHEAGVVHRDIKPSNLLLVDQNVRVADFGIARLSGSTLTQTGSRLGSASYMAPEQSYAPHTSTRATDVYGVAATFYALLTGLTPRGLFQLPRDHIRWLAVRNRRFRRAIRRAMALDPAARPDLETFDRVVAHGLARAHH